MVVLPPGNSRANPLFARCRKQGLRVHLLLQALKADRPVVIDVVTDIDALAPLAVT
jgi:hypothetical protein